MLIWVSFIYIFQMELVNDLRSWECVMEGKASVKWNILDEFVEEVNEHTNPHSEPQVEIQKTRGAVKKA